MPFPTHPQAAAFISDCWLALLIVWLIGLFNAKRSQERWRPLTAAGYVLASAATFSLLSGFPAWDEPRFVRRGPLPSLLAALFCLMGLVVAIWARLELGRNWSGAITYKQDHRLIERGPYRRIRHPIYTGLLLMVLGTMLLRGTPGAAAGALLFLVIHVWKLQHEEKLMLRHFPDSYPDYRSRTKALLPFLY